MAAAAVHPCSPIVASPSQSLHRSVIPLSNSSVCASHLQKTPIPNDPPRRTERFRKFNVPASFGTASTTQQSTEPDHASQSEKSNNKRKKTVKAKDDDAKGKKKAKKIADPNMPKRPPTAFFLFMSSFKEEFKKENPETKGVALVAKAGGAKWKSMSSDETLPFVKKAEEEKAAYEEKMKLYKSQDSSLIAEHSTDGSGSSTANSNDTSTSTEEVDADTMTC